MNPLKSSRRELLRTVGWHILPTAALFALVGAAYLRFVKTDSDPLAGGYLLLAYPSHFILLASLAVGLSGALAALLFPSRNAVGAVAVTTGIASLALIAVDAAVYTQYRFHLRGFIFDLLVNGGGEIFSFPPAMYATAVAALALAAVSQYLSWRLALKLANRERFPLAGWWAVGLTLGAFVGTQLIHIWADANYHAPVTSLTRHLPLFKPLTAKRFLAKMGLADLDENRRQASGKWRDRTGGVDYPKAKLEFNPPPTRKNLIYLVYECWRPDVLTPEVMAKTWEFSRRKGVTRYVNHLSGGNSTAAGIFSLFYSIPGLYYQAFAAEQTPPVLMESLKKAGYEFGVFSSAKITSPPLDRTVFAGLDDLRLSTQGHTAWVRDRQLVKDWLAWLDGRDAQKPFFGFIFLDSPHAYEFPPEYPRPFKPVAEGMNYLAVDKKAHKEEIFNLFRTSVHFADSLAGQILDDLERRGLLENTEIVITSDHGEEFDDNGKGYWGHLSNYSPAQTRVPLLVYRPGSVGGEVASRTSHLDLAPTMMDEVLGCVSDPLSYASGSGLDRSHASEGVFMASYNDYAVVEKDRIYLFEQDGATSVTDLALNPLKESPPPRLSAWVLREATRFYK